MRREPKCWHPKMPEGAEERPKIRVYAKQEINPLLSKRKTLLSVHKFHEAGRRGKAGLVQLPTVGNGAVKVGAFEGYLPRRTVGYVLDDQGIPYRLTSGIWLAWLALVLLAMCMLAASLLAVGGADSALPAVGGILPGQQVTTAVAAEASDTIRIKGLEDMSVAEGTVVELPNPEVNEDYLLRYTVKVKGRVVHESPCWIEPGKVDAWDAYADLARYSGKTVRATVDIEACTAGNFARCNGATQTVRVTVA